MYCRKCGAKNDSTAKFCENCGTSLAGGSAQLSAAGTQANPTTPDGITHSTVTVVAKSEAIIKCGNCGYIGPGQPGRSMWAKILALICIFGAPLITIIYFLVTYEYRCPKCQSTFLGIKRRDDKDFVSQSRTRRPLIIFLKILLGIAVIGILSAVVLASLNTARQKGADAAQQSQNGGWITYNSVAENFSILLPSYPTSDSKNDTTTGGTAYATNSHKVQDGNTTYYVYDYVYSDGLDASNPNSLLEKMLNIMSNGTNTHVVSSNYTSYGSYPALDFLIQAAGNEFVKGRLLLVNQVPFYLGYDYFSGNYVDSDYQRFINSLEIK